MKPSRVAVLGAGIMGSSVALALAARGVTVTLFDAAAQPFEGASRWNEGKIHLGYLYSAHGNLGTARHVIPGGLAFKPIVERYIGRSVAGAITTHDDTYLIHRKSVTSAESMQRYVAGVDALLQKSPEAGSYLVDLRGSLSRQLSSAELAQVYNAEHVVAGFRVPERSVDTIWLADQFVQALQATPKIELALKTCITGVRPAGGSADGPFHIETDAGADGPFDVVVNALWEGRPAIDAALGIHPPAAWSHRFRLAVFLRTKQALSLPSTVIAAGPFGDIKCYPDRNFYLSWYAAGLRAEGHDITPPSVATLEAGEKENIVSETFSRLATIIPAVRNLRECTECVRVEGGWVYAVGQGALSDPGSTLHRRDALNIQRAGSYFSIDTAKYSIAPWLAEQVASAICE